MRSRSQALFALTLFAVLGSSSSAAAFCRATTCDPTKTDGGCPADAQGCLALGTPLAWASNCVTVSVQADGAPMQHIDFAAAQASVSRAFAAWTNAACAGGPPSILVKVEGPIDCATPEYNSDHGNANIVMFREDTWPYPGGQDALGVTWINFDPASGEIWDADIEVNAVDEPLSVGKPSATQVDLDSLLTHEAGHLLGLAHSRDQAATMFAGYHRGSIELRSLAPDDVTGVCAIYPPTRKVATSSCEPRHGYADLCAAEQVMMTPAGDEPLVHSSCTMAAGKRSNSSWLASLLSACAACFALRRTPRKRRSAR